MDNGSQTAFCPLVSVSNVVAGFIRRAFAWFNVFRPEHVRVSVYKFIQAMDDTVDAAWIL